MGIQGENFVVLVGKLTKPDFKVVGQNNLSMFKAGLAIPTSDGRKQYIKICAWYDLADSLKEIDNKTFIKIHGHIEESSFDSNCRYCNAKEKKYWTQVIVDNYTILNEEGDD